MSPGVGNYVVYCSREICLIESVVKRCFDGVNETDYFRLVPIESGNSAYYIPCDNYMTKVRPLLTEEEIYSLIDEMPGADEKWCSDRNERKHLFNSVLKSNDYHEIISMMRSLYIHRERRLSEGKKLLASDERVIGEAEHLIHQEIAFVLGMEEADVRAFIVSRIGNGSADTF